VNDFEAKQAAEELDNVEIGQGAIKAQGGAAQIHAGGQPVANKSEEDKLRELEKMMMALK
jgi:hypothetical protein